MKKQAIWNGQVIAESDDLVRIEGNYYFPKESIKSEFFSSSDTQTLCPWKGTASYYSINVDGKINTDAAWYYPKTSGLAEKIQGYVAFWKGVEVQN